MYKSGVTVYHTSDGGLARLYINKTGAASVKGTVVELDDSNNQAVKIVPTSGSDSIGAIFNNGIQDGDYVYVVFSGPAQVLLEDSTASTTGNWVRVSTTQAGRADATLTSPPAGGVTELDSHMTELGHCMESVTAGTDKLAMIHLHFN